MQLRLRGAPLVSQNLPRKEISRHLNAFVAIVTKRHPSKLELLAYHATILTEALSCKGWLSYDKMFHQHIEKAMLYPMFYSLIFLSQCVDATTCPRCMGPDHGKADCALASPESEQEHQRNRSSDTERQSGPSRKCFCRDGTPQSSSQTAGAPEVNFSFSYNEGQCFRYPKPCDREHRCIRCGKEHRMMDCTATLFHPLLLDLVMMYLRPSLSQL